MKKQAVHLPTWKLLVSFQPIKVLKRQSTGNLRRNFRDFRQQLEIPPQWRMMKSDRQENLSVLSEHSVWSMDGTFKIVPEWYQQMFTIHVFIA
ncbi:hypothetical protein T03_1957, partial [Trichinella britovi]